MKKSVFSRFCFRLPVYLPVCLLLLAAPVAAQPPSRISIEEAWQKARDNYPLIKQKALLRSTREYTVENAAKGYLPMLSFSGQASYQSAVTTFPFKLPDQGFKLPEYSKDQYRVFGEVSQLVYDGGLIRYQQQTAEANEQVQQQTIEVQLFALYEQVNQLFFGALLLNEQLKQNELLQQDIRNASEKMQALVANGLALKSSVDELSAQALQTRQEATQLRSVKMAFLNMLALFMNTSITENTELLLPSTPVLQQPIRRPELQMFEAQKKLNDMQRQLLRVQLRPRFNLFVQGGYGRPGLNMLSNDFAGYYIGGIRAYWNLGTLYTLRNQRHLIGLSNEIIDVQQQTFLFNTNMQLRQQNHEIKMYAALLENDDEVIVLRQNVKRIAAAQLENGVLSAHDYLSHVIAEDKAKQNRILHQVQLLQAEYRHQVLTGQIIQK